MYNREHIAHAVSRFQFFSPHFPKLLIRTRYSQNKNNSHTCTCTCTKFVAVRDRKYNFLSFSPTFFGIHQYNSTPGSSKFVTRFDKRGHFAQNTNLWHFYVSPFQESMGFGFSCWFVSSSGLVLHKSNVRRLYVCVCVVPYSGKLSREKTFVDR